jgi:hypothetical protein
VGFDVLKLTRRIVESPGQFGRKGSSQQDVAVMRQNCSGFIEQGGGSRDRAILHQESGSAQIEIRVIGSGTDCVFERPLSFDGPGGVGTSGIPGCDRQGIGTGEPRNIQLALKVIF